mgnify:CR=1 FL=1|jgi:hypothetical protein|tara:strand:+ start:2377 stop:3423 length:1047 start_codon:yes stop_codon:yes gene_type:complete
MSSLPIHIQQNLIAGVRPHEKRVVLNLAEVSRIKNDNGTYRTYEDFVGDWKYMHSTFVKKEVCTLCNKKDIREACHVKDAVSGVSIIVGNECVYKHIEITTDGLEGLTGDAKRDFLKAKMAEAKARFFAADFSTKYNLKEWDRITDVIDAEPRWRIDSIEEIDRRYYNSAKRMIATKGYIPATTNTHHWFDTTWHKWHGITTSITARKERRAVEQIEAKAKSLVITNRRIADATAFRVIAEQMAEDGEIGIGTLNEYLSQTVQHIRTHGISNWGWRKAHEQLYNQVMAGASTGGSTKGSDIDRAIASDKTNDWEKGFLRSIEQWIIDGKSMSGKQQAIHDRIMAKVKS